MKPIEAPTPRCAAVHDLASYGHMSLTTAIPILNTMGVQVFPLPTAVYSSSTGVEGYYGMSLTPSMRKIVAHWKQLKLTLHGIYTGFLGDKDQVDVVKDLIEWQRPNEPLVVVDPVCADNGVLYPAMDLEFVKTMMGLVEKADIITPNITELSFLLHGEARKYATLQEVREDARVLAERGPEIVVVTSVPYFQSPSPRRSQVIGYSRLDGRCWSIPCEYLPGDYHGTGDAFASVLTGALMQHDSLPIALERAVHFASAGVRAAYGYPQSGYHGILLERILPLLNAPAHISSFEVLD